MMCREIKLCFLFEAFRTPYSCIVTKVPAPLDSSRVVALTESCPPPHGVVSTPSSVVLRIPLGQLERVSFKINMRVWVRAKVRVSLLW